MGCAASTQATGQQPSKVTSGGEETATVTGRPSAVKALEEVQGVHVSKQSRSSEVQKEQAAETGMQARGGTEEHAATLEAPKGDAAHKAVDASIDAAAQMREKWMSELGEGWDDVSGDVDIVLEGVEKLVGLFQSLKGNAKQEEAPVDIQSLELSKRTKLEQGFAKYSALGQVLIQVAGPAMESMPFGAPAAAILGAVYARASQAAKLSRNCEELLQLMKRVDAQLARVLDNLATSRTKPPAEVEDALRDLMMQIIRGGKLMRAYGQRGFVLRFIHSNGDARKFQDLDTGIHHAMENIAFCVSMDFLATKGTYNDESAKLREAVCKQAGLPEDQAEEAVCQLSRKDPGLLRELMKEHGNFTTQVINAELGALSELLQKALGKIAELEAAHARAAMRQEDYTQLAGYLKDWWAQTMGKRARSAPLDKFCTALIQWFKDHKTLDQLLEYEDDLEKEFKQEGLPESLIATSKKIHAEEGGRPLHFLSLVVLPLLDGNMDSTIERTELLGLQVTAEEFAKKIGEPQPSSLTELLDTIFQGFDKAMLSRTSHAAGSPIINRVSEGLQVRKIIQSYRVNTLLESHVSGTRQWLFDRVNKWLESAIKGKAAADAADNRMFLLLAGPGMGKSVFSAVMEKRLMVHAYAGQIIQVRHFFKVGEQRAQGKAMVLCLAQQLADALPQMAAKLEPVVKEHGNASSLSMLQAFKRYLLDPLKEVDNDLKEQSGKIVVVMLLDALDEACDGNAGFEAVAALVSKEFIKLPPWVKLIVTGRPQAESPFSAWTPDWITPSNQDNQADMRLLLQSRLQQGCFVAAEDVPAAVEVMLEKSQGQFICAKYSFDELSAREGLWKPAEIEAVLPLGLYGVFRHIMSTLKEALDEEQPELSALMSHKLLPILVSASVPLTPSQLSAMAGADLAQMEVLLRLLSNLFPMRMDGITGNMKVVPYHKSVLDWLVDKKAGLGLDMCLGQSILGTVCHDAIKAAAAEWERTGKSLCSL